MDIKDMIMEIIGISVNSGFYVNGMWGVLVRAGQTYTYYEVESALKSLEASGKIMKAAGGYYGAVGWYPKGRINAEEAERDAATSRYAIQAWIEDRTTR